MSVGQRQPAFQLALQILSFSIEHLTKSGYSIEILLERARIAIKMLAIVKDNETPLDVVLGQIVPMVEFTRRNGLSILSREIGELVDLIREEMNNTNNQ